MTGIISFTDDVLSLVLELDILTDFFKVCEIQLILLFEYLVLEIDFV